MFRDIIKAAIVAGFFWSVPAIAQVSLTAETVSPGGPTYLSPAHLVEVSSLHGIANIQLTDGQTLTNSLLNVAEGKTDIAATPFVLPFMLKHGLGPYGFLGAEKGSELSENLRAINPFIIGVFLLYAYDSKGLGGWDDLAGRKVFNGPPRGGALANSRSMAQLVTGLREGHDYEGIQVNWGQAVRLITSGEPDAILLPVTFPGTAIMLVTAVGDATGWSVPKAAFEAPQMHRYMRAPGNAPFTMPVAELTEVMGPGWTFVSEDDLFRSFASIGGNVVHKDIDDDLVYRLVSSYVATLDALESKVPYGKTVGFRVPMQGMCGDNPLKYHPAAARAWREAGYVVDDCAIAAD